MPTNTTNFNLIKPIQGEFYNVDAPNNNMDTIDGVLKTLQDAINSGASEQDLTTLRNALTTHLANDTNHVKYAADTGTANAKVVTINVADKTLKVKIELTVKGMFQAVEEMLERITPQNMVLTVELRFNQHSLLTKYTHAELAVFTHEQLRNEVLT